MTPHRLITAAVMLLLTASLATTQAQGVAWQTDLDQARQTAKDSGRLVLLHFWTESCGPCKRLDATVFNQPSVASAIEQHFVPVKINANAAPELAQAMRIKRVPTDVIVTPDGKVLTQLVSPATPIDYVAKLRQVAVAEATKAGNAFKLAAANSPYGPVVNQAYAGLAAVATAESSAPSVAPSINTPASNITPESGSNAQTPAVNRQPQLNPYAGPTTSTSNPAATAAGAKSNPGVASASGSPQLPPGAPPVVFDGYCTVTMKQRNTWQIGDPQFGVIHQGRTYLFAGAAERDAFFKAPDAYAPVLAGVDPVLALDQGKATPGQRQFSVEYEDRFYLFSNEQTLKTFWQDPARYAAGVRQALTAGTTPDRR